MWYSYSSTRPSFKTYSDQKSIIKLEILLFFEIRMQNKTANQQHDFSSTETPKKGEPHWALKK